MTADWFPKTESAISAVVLAATQGSRLFPLTSAETPKHLLPIAGVPCIIRLMDALKLISHVIICVAEDDKATFSVLEEIATKTSDTTLETKAGQKITLLRLPENNSGSADAIRKIEEEKLVAESSHLVVVPGDLVVLNQNAIEPFLRPPLSGSDQSACSAVLVDVGEQDEHGLPLKESAKAKKGGLARDEDDVEYIGLSYPPEANPNEPNTPRMVLKQSKLDVEVDDMTGSTPKLEIPKPRMLDGKLVVRTEWSDVHLYMLSPWVRKLICIRENIMSIQGDLLQLLISRQYRGKKATFGSSLKPKDDEPPKLVVEDEPYSVLARVVESKSVLRANTIPSYLFACKEVVARGSSLAMPPNSKWNGKFHSLVLEGSTLGAKLTMVDCVVGKSCQIGAKCRFKNVVIMDSVVIGEGCSLQNTVVGAGVELGANCSLNDCQVGPGKHLPANTKEKGESFMVGDAIDEEEML